MNDLIKQDLHQHIDKCNNELLLEEARELLQTDKDWWDELTEEDRNLVMESEAEYEKGNVISNEDLMKQFEEWKKK